MLVTSKQSLRAYSTQAAVHLLATLAEHIVRQISHFTKKLKYFEKRANRKLREVSSALCATRLTKVIFNVH